MPPAPTEPGPIASDFGKITNAVPALISFFDADLICRFANDHHRNWYGLDPASLIGLHFRDFVGDRVFELRKPYLARVAALEAVAFDAKVPHRLDGYRDSSIRYMPRQSADGVFEGFYILIFDTAWHQLRFRGVFDAMAVAFWEIDFTAAIPLFQSASDPHAHLTANPGLFASALAATTVIDVNDKAVELFGAPDKAALLGSFDRFWPPASARVFAQALLAAIEGQPHFEAETKFARLDGSEFEGALTCAFPGRVGERAAFTMGIVDISARIAAQDAAAKLRSDLAHASRVASLGELTASIAHEVNQPLAAIVTSGQAAKRWLDRPVPDLAETRVAIERMIDDATRAAEIISRIRAMAQKGDAQHTQFSLNEMVEQSLAILSREIAAQDVLLTLDLAPANPVIEADRIQIQQVLINLVVNAIQAMAEMPAPRDLTVHTSADANLAILEVRDSGPGIDPARATQLFNAFYTTKPTGMGMGLSIARTIIEAHDGRIEAGTNPPRGAVFRVTLPAVPQVAGA